MRSSGLTALRANLTISHNGAKLAQEDVSELVRTAELDRPMKRLRKAIDDSLASFEGLRNALGRAIKLAKGCQELRAFVTALIERRLRRI